MDNSVQTNAGASCTSLSVSRHATRRRSFTSILLRLVAVLLVLALSFLALVLLFPQRLLTIDSGEVQADALIVLGGGATERATRAVELYRAGAAPRIVVSGTGDCESNILRLEQHGVPADAITGESLSASTAENAEFSIPLLRKMGARRVIIVTSWYHSRRALACFEHFGPDILFYSRPSYNGYPRDEWNSRGIGDYAWVEFVKLAGYWYCYGVRPFPL